jgi:hypothetical protein
MRRFARLCADDFSIGPDEYEDFDFSNYATKAAWQCWLHALRCSPQELLFADGHCLCARF